MTALKSYKIYELVKSAQGREYLLSLKEKLKELDNKRFFDDYSKLDANFKKLSNEEITVLKSIDEIDLADYGRQVKIVSSNTSTPDLDKITEQPVFIVNSKPQQIKRTIYLPRKVMEHYQRMNAAYQMANPDRAILLDSGYRHPIEQRYLVVFFLVNSYGYSLEEVLKRVLPPPYSQHCSPSYTALDLCNIDAEIDPDDKYTTAFALTPEYLWLKKHGKEFGFHESYPEGNNEGIVWEPWHWQFRP